MRLEKTIKINNQTVSLIAVQDEETGCIGISYLNSQDENLGSPWQYLGDNERVNLQAAFAAAKAEMM